jgi:glycine hydroxymethyltransferase
MSYIKKYFSLVPQDAWNPSAISFYGAVDSLEQVFPEISQAILKELKDQRTRLKLIASENYSSLAVQLAMGNLLTDKYSEGFPSHRFYAGCENVDLIESKAVELAKKLFGADHAYVQPHSGADANLVAFWAIITQRVQLKELNGRDLLSLTHEEYERVREKLVSQKVLGLDLGSGGHLTHGFRHNVSSKMMQASSYKVDPVSGLIDYKTLQEQVTREKPLILIAGYSAYSRKIDFAKMREIADSVGAVLLVDMAHFAGLVAGKVMQGNFNPIPFAHVVTSTTHKTLRGPRGGLVLCTNEFKEAVDKGCPTVLGGPLPHVMAAKAVAFQEALSPSFTSYARQIVNNAQTLSEALLRLGAVILTGGTENHLLVMDVAKTYGLNGRMAESILREAHLTVNRNSIPEDQNGAWYTSGIRLGTPALTTLGMKEDEMKEIAKLIHTLLKSTTPIEGSKAKALAPPDLLFSTQNEVKQLLSKFPLYPELTID